MTLSPRAGRSPGALWLLFALGCVGGGLHKGTWLGWGEKGDSGFVC